MRIDRDRPEQMIVSHVAWLGAVLWGCFGMIWVLVAALAVVDRLGIWPVAILAGPGVLCLIIALRRAERSLLVLDRTAGTAHLSRADFRGRRQMHWPLAEVHGTRIRAENRWGVPAARDKTRWLDLYVPRGMDEGRHPLTLRQLPAEEAKEVSRRVNAWMKEVRVEFADAYVPPADAAEPGQSPDSATEKSTR